MVIWNIPALGIPTEVVVAEYGWPVVGSRRSVLTEAPSRGLPFSSITWP